MKITIKECLKLHAFEGAEILAGKKRLNSIIKKVTVLEEVTAEDIDATYEEKNVMIVTAFFGTRNDVEEQCKMIERSVLCGMSVLVLHRIGDILGKVDERLVDICEKLGVVLIALNAERRIQTYEILEEVSHILYYGSVNEAKPSLLTDVAFHMINFEKYPDFVSALRTAAELNEFQVVLMSSDFNPVLAVETKSDTTVEAAIMFARKGYVEKKKLLCTMIEVDGLATYWIYTNIEGSDYYMLIADNKDMYSKDEIIKLGNIITMAMGMWKYTPKKDDEAEFIRALRRGNINKAFAIKDDAKIDESSVVSVFLCVGLLEQDTRDKWNEYCEKKGIKALKTRDNDETTGILLGHKKNNNAVKTFDVLDETYHGKIFHVTGINGIEGAADGFRLIEETHGLAKVVFPHKSNFSKYDLSLIRNCIHIRNEGGFLKRNYTKLLDVFDEENSAKGRELLRTLETFILDAGMNSGKTAEILDVHTNTVQYRMKRINELLGVEITAYRVVPGISTALALHRLETMN